MPVAELAAAASSTWTIPYLLIADWVIRITMAIVVLLRRRSEPSVSLAWLVLVVSIPIVGTIIYLLVGETRLGRSRVARHAEIVARVERPEVRLPHSPAARAHKLGVHEEQLALLAESVGGNVPLAGNRLELFGDTDVVIQRLVEDIDAAQEHCHMLFYIYLDDDSGRRVGEALARAAMRGVKARLLVDDVGSRDFLRSPLRRQIAAEGVAVAGALPASLPRMLLQRIDLRNHRKIAVIDGRIGWTGSQNIANAEFAPKAHYAPWVDCMVRIQGPVVHDLQTLFVEDWFLDSSESVEAVLRHVPDPLDHGCTAQFLGTGPGSSRAAMRLLIQAMVQLAREELVLTTPYFVPDEATLLTLCATARRGVKVHLVVPRRNDSRLVALASRGFYEPLLDSGVEIREFNGGLLHAKTLVVDRHICLISSANLDRRSFELNFETGLVVYDDDFSSQLRFLQTGYMESSTRVDPSRWRDRSWPARLAQNAAGLMGPLL
ncbi:MAG TPA: cardiolipin synthase [Phycisphaerales bacterium]|nr:cardiolipin synthase [Phycisphaerales bacterium]HMP37172.1 cardiolipin synthase [Phycisphaerales bacterium]